MRLSRLATGLMIALLGLGACAHHGPHGGGGARSATVSMQDDATAWMADPHMHAYYELARATFAQGPDKVDLPKFEQESYAVFRAFAVSRGWKPEAMVDHLKDIPRQLVQIVRDDPHALDTYETFTLAMIGPP